MPEAGVAPPTHRLPLDEAQLAAQLSGRHVLLTGHSGFKGGWMALWLQRLGARVTGVSLPPPPGPSLHDALGLDRLVDGRVGDIRDPVRFRHTIADVDADAVIHMAAQAIVRRGHADPVDTYLTNVVGTAAVLEAVRAMPSCRAVVVVTSDKCYDNRDWPWGYRETDALGGADPYSASKACTELVADSYRRTWFSEADAPRLATVRAGNVFGGGDWAADRLVPDIVRATLAGDPAFIRNPASVRPWQHVLEPLAGYLAVLASLLADGRAAEAWNFGPGPADTVDVRTLAGLIAGRWGAGGPRFRFGSTDDRAAPEARTLAIDSAKAHARLGWQPRLALEEAVGLTVDWYRHWASGAANMADFTRAQIESYVCRRAAHAVGETLKCA